MARHADRPDPIVDVRRHDASIGPPGPNALRDYARKESWHARIRDPRWRPPAARSRRVRRCGRRRASRYHQYPSLRVPLPPPHDPFSGPHPDCTYPENLYGATASKFKIPHISIPLDHFNLELVDPDAAREES